MSKNKRRRFLRALGMTTLAATLPGRERAAGAGARDVPLAFSTMGCPEWDWQTILRRAAEFGYRGIELRGIQGEMDLTKRPEFAGGRLAASVREVEALNLRLINLCASTRLHEADRVKRQAGLDEARRFVDLAHRLRAPYVRVFPDKLVRGEPKEATVARIVMNLRGLGEHARGSGVTVLLESHGDFTDSATLGEILTAAAMPTVGLLWDTGHTFARGHERPAETYRRLRPFIRLAQFIDVAPADGAGDVRYRLLGEGRMPVREALRALAEGGYQGYYSFDWPKLWHRELAAPEVAFPHFVKVVREYLRSLA